MLLDLVMPDPDGYAVSRHIRARAELAEIPVVVLTALDSDEEIHRVFSSGADDYVHKPFRPAELVARIRGQMRMREYVERLSRRERDQQTVLELTQALASSLDIRDILFTVVQRVADVARVDRCSIVLVGEPSTSASSWPPATTSSCATCPSTSDKYPEIREVLSTGRALVIRDAKHHPLLEVVRQNEPAIEFSSLALMPILHEHGPMGVIFLRSRRTAAFADHEMSLVHTVANATAIALRNARILQSLRDETQQSTFARVEAERRVQLFQRYADFFESAADGMVVIDRTGHVLFANPRAREITGYSETELMTLQHRASWSSSASASARNACCAASARAFIRAASTSTSAPRTRSRADDQRELQLGFARRQRRAVHLPRRDAGAQDRDRAQADQGVSRARDRQLGRRHRVAPICAARVLLFNRAAARIFGYHPSDVVGKMSVERLYPPGVRARGDAADPRSERQRPGQARGLPRRHGERRAAKPIPVTLTAALIMENGTAGRLGRHLHRHPRKAPDGGAADESAGGAARAREAGDRRRARRRGGARAQPAADQRDRLRRALAAQPRRQQAALQRRGTIILSESERMAEIVRKIGKITKYETKSYVGGAKILDLEKASEEPASKDAQR